MSREQSGKGQLIAVDGASGLDLAGMARRVLAEHGKGRARGGVSLWDASNIFFEIRLGKPEVPALSARLLVLLYASDLAFRLRWEILSTLEGGQRVVAAPYVNTAIAFGLANGLERRWLRDVFRFAPRADLSYVADAREIQAGGKAGSGFLEFCCAALASSTPSWNAAAFLDRFTGCLMSGSGQRAH